MDVKPQLHIWDSKISSNFKPKWGVLEYVRTVIYVDGVCPADEQIVPVHSYLGGGHVVEAVLAVDGVETHPGIQYQYNVSNS